MYNKTNFTEFNDKRIYIFGAGKIGKATLDSLPEDLKIISFIDNNKERQGLAFEGLDIIAVEDAVLLAGTVIVIATLDYGKVYSQLKRIFPELDDADIYVSVSWKIPYADDHKKTGYDDIEFSRSRAYELLADEYSRLLFDFILDVRGGDVNIFSWENISFLDPDSAYWHGFSFPDTGDCAILDCGAFTGDSIREILDILAPDKCTYYAFEPDKNIMKALIDTENSTGQKNVDFINIAKGVGLKKAYISFHYNTDDAASSVSGNQNLSQNGKGTVEIINIDSLDIKEKNIFIKMDIEGAEASALRGAQKLIKAKKPALAVCAYHRPSDLFMLPELILHLNPEYKIYLRGGLHYAYYAF